MTAQNLYVFMYTVAGFAGIGIGWTRRWEWLSVIMNNATPLIFVWAFGVWVQGGHVVREVSVRFLVCALILSLAMATGALVRSAREKRGRRK